MILLFVLHETSKSSKIAKTRNNFEPIVFVNCFAIEDIRDLNAMDLFKIILSFYLFIQQF